MTRSPVSSAIARHLAPVAGALALALLTGCASAPGADPRDPWESYNRSMTRFNDAVDNAVLKPVATAYRDVVPSPVRTGVSNFFGNLSDVWSFVNNVLQAKPEGALHSFWRVVINTTMGLGGVLDPASEMRLQRHREDFGQTLGYWGVPDGPYVVLPLLGPSTLRDTAGLPVDWYGYPVGQIGDVSVRNSLYGLNFLQVRASVLGATDIMDAAALDSYSFRRDAYLQKRRNDIYDGNPPQDDERYDLSEPPAEPAAPASAPVSQAAPETDSTAQTSTGAARAGTAVNIDTITTNASAQAESSTSAQMAEAAEIPPEALVPTAQSESAPPQPTF